MGQTFSFPQGWKIDATIAGLALGTIGSAISFMGANDNKADQYHVGLRKAIIETVIVGVGMSLVVKSYWPLVAPLGYIVVDQCYYKMAQGNAVPNDREEEVLG
jgi:hypothetical protein